MTDNTPSTDETPSPDGLPRRRKPAARAAAPVPSEEALADLEAAAYEAEEAAAEAAAPSEPEIEESLRQRGLRLSALEIAHMIVEAAEDKKAADIVLLDVS